MADYKRIQGAGDQEAALIVEGEDISDMAHRLTQSLLWATRDELAYYSSIDTMLGDVLAMSDSCDYDLNIGQDVWLTESRWSTLIRQYVEPEWLFKFLDGVKEVSTYGRGIIAMDMKRVEPTVVESNKRANRRKRGSCMRFMTYRAFPYPTISLYSRTSYIGYIGSLDLLLAHKIVELAADMIGEGLKVEDFRFRWHIEAAQWHGFKSMAYIYAAGLEGYLKKWPKGKIIEHPATGEKFKVKDIETYPSWKITKSWWDRIKRLDKEGVLYEDMKYGAEKRVRRRLHAQTGRKIDRFIGSENPHEVLDLPIEQVTLDRMIYKTPESRAIMKRKKREKAEALIGALFSDDEVLVGIDPGESVNGAARAGVDPSNFDDLVEDAEDLIEIQ